MLAKQISQAVDWIKESSYTVAFTGAGISVESGIPPFRGENGIWNKYDPKIFDLEYFTTYPIEDWKLMYEVFYKTIFSAKPNSAHKALAQMEKQGFLHSVITQNIDNLHYEAGNKVVREFHGNTRDVVCMQCGKKYAVKSLDFSKLPPRCDCGGLLKPDFVFFGEPIPSEVLDLSVSDAQKCDVMIVIGTTGVIYPAAQIPIIAKQHGAKIIEINIQPSEYTNSITDLFLEGKASDMLTMIVKELK